MGRNGIADDGYSENLSVSQEFVDRNIKYIRLNLSITDTHVFFCYFFLIFRKTMK